MRLTRRPRLLGQDMGSTSSIGLAVAAATLAIGFVLAEVMVSEPAGMDARTGLYDAHAATALDLIVQDAGVTSTKVDWSRDPDKLSRFGLAVSGTPNFLDYEKIKALRNGTFTRDLANAKPDYPEVKDALGIQGLDVHLRTYPVLASLDDPRWTKEQHGRVAYFGHYSGATSPLSVTNGTTKDASKLNASITLQNAGAESAIYTVAISLADKDKGDRIVTEERHTRLLAPGESQVIWAHFHARNDWDSDIDSVRFEITDPYGNIAVDAVGDTVGDFYVDQTPPSGSGGYGLLVSAGSFYYVSGNQVKFFADHFDGEGDHANQNQSARFVLVGPNGKEWVNQSVWLPKEKNQVYAYECPNCTDAGTYVGILWDKDLTRKHQDVVHVSATQLFAGKTSMSSVALAESGYVKDLVVNFNPTRYDPASNEAGDVFGDDSNGPNDLIDVLDRYTTLIIGSEVKQTALNAAETKQGIADWVQEGGNLVVLGTKKQQSRWLEPIYHAAQTNANGGISAPDPTHPILQTPDRLQYERYLDRGRAWDVDKDQPFTHVLNRGESGNSMLDTLVVSNPGALGNGTVVLSSYMPGSLTDPQDPQEAKRFLHNLLSQSHTMLFLDFGPPIPESVPVGSAQRLVAIPHPNVPGAVVETRIVLYVFG